MLDCWREFGVSKPVAVWWLCMSSSTDCRLLAVGLFPTAFALASPSASVLRTMAGSNLELCEDAVAGMLDRIETLVRKDDVALSEAWKERKRKLDVREDQLLEREADVLRREKAVAEREAAFAKSSQKPGSGVLLSSFFGGPYTLKEPL